MIPEQKLEYLVGAIVCRDLTGWMLVTKGFFGDTAEFALDLCPGVRLSCQVELDDPLSRPTFGISMDMGFTFEADYLRDVHLCRGDVEFRGDSTDITIAHPAGTYAKSPGGSYPRIPGRSWIPDVEPSP